MPPLELAGQEPALSLPRLPARPPRRGRASTIVLEKDKKGRLVRLTVDGQPVETRAAGRKNKRSKKVRTTEIVRVPALPMRPVEPEPLAGQASKFDFSPAEVAAENRRSLTQALTSPDLTSAQRRVMEAALRQLKYSSSKSWDDYRRQMQSFNQRRALRFNFNGAAAGRLAHPRYYLEYGKRGGKLKFVKPGALVPGEAAWPADPTAEQAADAADQAARAAEQANLAARRAELRARIAADAAELRALDHNAPRQRAPLPPTPPLPPQQGPPSPTPPPAPKTGALRDALRQDGLIGKDEHNFSFSLNDQGGKVNGRALTPAQVARYRQLLDQPVSGQGKTSTFSIHVEGR